MSPLPKIEFDTARFVERWHEGATMAQLGAEFGGTGSWAGNQCIKLGLRRQINTGDLPGNTIEALYVEHRKTSTWIAKKLGTSHSVITRLLRSRGVEIRKGGKQWVDKRAQCVALRRQGLTYPEIGERVGLTEDQVGRQVRMVLGTGRRGVPHKVPLDELVRLRKKRMTYRAIAETVGLHPATVSARLRDVVILEPDPNRPTDEELKALRKEGLSFAAIAARLGMKKPTVFKRLRGTG